MAVKKPALGKGLSALITENTSEENINNIIEVDINKVEPGIGQPRKNFDKEKIDALAESIKEHGIIQPLIVKKENDIYYIIAGERRWRAARVAGYTKIPVIERSATTKEIMELALIENIQREDLNPIEEAEAYQKLMQEFSMTQENLSKIIGKSRSTVANILRLLNFSEKTRNLLISGELSIGQARPILILDSYEEQDEAADYIVKMGLNSRQVEQYIKKISLKKKKELENDSENENNESEYLKKQEIRYVQDTLRMSLGTKVTLSDDNGKGKITIEYYTKDERERLIELLSNK